MENSLRNSMKAILILLALFSVLIGALTILSLHVENFVYGGWEAVKSQLSFPKMLLPERVKRGFSIAAVIAAGLSGWLAVTLFNKLIVKKWGWVSEEGFKKLFGK